MLETSINKSLGPFFLKGDSTRGWTIPAVNENVEKMCSWHIELFDNADTLFDKHLRRYRSLLPPERETLSKNFNEVVRLLSVQRSLCNEKLKEPIGLFRSYLDEVITKKNLSEVITDPEIALLIMNMKTTLQDMDEAIVNFQVAYKSFISNYDQFFITLDSSPWPFITNPNLRNFNFLGQMMEWYDHFKGKELLQKYLELNGELNGNVFPENITFTGLNISKVIDYAVEGFRTKFDVQTGFSAFVTDIEDSVIGTAQSLLDQFDTIRAYLTAYQNKIIMDEQFYA